MTSSEFDYIYKDTVSKKNPIIFTSTGHWDIRISLEGYNSTYNSYTVTARDNIVTKLSTAESSVTNVEWIRKDKLKISGTRDNWTEWLREFDNKTLSSKTWSVQENQVTAISSYTCSRFALWCGLCFELKSAIYYWTYNFPNGSFWVLFCNILFFVLT